MAQAPGVLPPSLGRPVASSVFGLALPLTLRKAASRQPSPLYLFSAPPSLDSHPLLGRAKHTPKQSRKRSERVVYSEGRPTAGMGWGKPRSSRGGGVRVTAPHARAMARAGSQLHLQRPPHGMYQQRAKFRTQSLQSCKENESGFGSRAAPTPQDSTPRDTQGRVFRVQGGQMHKKYHGVCRTAGWSLPAIC